MHVNHSILVCSYKKSRLQSGLTEHDGSTPVCSLVLKRRFLALTLKTSSRFKRLLSRLFCFFSSSSSFTNVCNAFSGVSSAEFSIFNRAFEPFCHRSLIKSRFPKVDVNGQLSKLEITAKMKTALDNKHPRSTGNKD